MTGATFIVTFYAPGSFRLLNMAGKSKRKKKRADDAEVCAQGVSYGCNFLTLSGTLTSCPGGHINLVSLNKVL